MEPYRVTGTVTWFNEHKGIGVIKGENGVQATIEFRQIITPRDRILREGQVVSMIDQDGKNGPEAVEVELRE
jgi:cold shock CspA family protein